MPLTSKIAASMLWVKGTWPWGSKSAEKGQGAGLNVLSVAEASKAADLIMILLLADEVQGFTKPKSAYLEQGKVLAFAHGFNIHFARIGATSR